MSGNRRACSSAFGSILFSSACASAFARTSDRLASICLNTGTLASYMDRDMRAFSGWGAVHGNALLDCLRFHFRIALAPDKVLQRRPGCRVSIESPRHGDTRMARACVVFIQGGGEGAHAEDQALADSLQRLLSDAYEVRFPQMPDEADPDTRSWKSMISRELA